MVREYSDGDLQSILQAIKSSDVIENRVILLTELADSDISDKLGLISVAECLTHCSTVGTLTTVLALWEDFSCMDVSQCLLNKAIIHVAAKHIELNISESLGHFLILGTKASIWCGKHLKITLLSTEESQDEEEHSNIFFQLLLNLLSFFTLSIKSLTRHPIQGDETLMAILEKYILEQLNLIRELVSDIKMIQSFSSQVLTAVQLVLDAEIELYGVYFHIVNWVESDSVPEIDSICERDDSANHIANIMKYAVEILCELGTIAANTGGSLVTILNISWKGVVNLLHLGKGALVLKFDVSKIILALISLASGSLRCAAEAWSTLKKPVSSAEAKRSFVPAKFFLITAARIALLYPSEACSLYKQITLCVLIISTFSFYLAKDIHLRAASEVSAEFLEPAAFILLNSILNSDKATQMLKLQILDCLFNDERDSISTNGGPSCGEGMSYMDALFSVTCEVMSKARVLLAGRVAVFLYHLNASSELEKEVRLGLIGKLEWLLNVLVDEEVYAAVLSVQIPTLSGKPKELFHQPMYSLIIHALKAFMIVVSSSSDWEEVFPFLLYNLLHPHFLCRSIITELWCFMARHASINDIIHNLCLLLKLLSSFQSVLIPGCALRALARLICMILSNGSQSFVCEFYCSILRDEKDRMPSVIYLALLLEGFPVNLLTDDLKIKTRDKVITDYVHFIENFDEKSLQACDAGLFGAPVYTVSAALRSLQISTSDIDMKTLKFLVAIIQSYKNSFEDPIKEQSLKLLGETLAIASNANHLYASDEVEEVILELKKLFISDQPPATKLNLRKSELSFFMAELARMKLIESDSCLKSCAVWELFHMLLKERHWALAHLAITAFTYYAERTSCTQLWRFVPRDAALAFDLDTGMDPKEERFMGEIKSFLDKEKALTSTTPGCGELGILTKEGLILKEMTQKFANIGFNGVDCESVEVKQVHKRRRLPEGISEGMELLQSGLKVIGDCLSKMPHHDSVDFFTQFSRLENVIDHMAGLASTG